MSERGKSVSVGAALAAIGDGHQVHVLTEAPEGHMTASVIQRELFDTMIRMPTCKLTIAKQKFAELNYPLRVETSQSAVAYYVFCTRPLSSE